MFPSTLNKCDLKLCEFLLTQPAAAELQNGRHILGAKANHNHWSSAIVTGLTVGKDFTESQNWKGPRGPCSPTPGNAANFCPMSNNDYHFYWCL